MLASFSFHDDGQASRTVVSPPLSAVRHLETGRTENSAIGNTRREGYFDLTEPETSSDDSDDSHIVTRRRVQPKSATWSRLSVNLAPLMPIGRPY